MTASVKQQKMQFCPLPNEKRLLERSGKELMKKYGEKDPGGGRNMGKLIKNVATFFVGMSMGITRHFPKSCSRVISELSYFSSDRTL